MKKYLKDRFYKKIFTRYKSEEKVIAAGWFDDGYDVIDYKLNILTTPVNKVVSNLKNCPKDKTPIVLLSTGGFYPIHDGHFNMMESAKQILNQSGYYVVGGFFSPCNDSYTNTKPNFNINKYERINLCFKQVENSDWLSIDPYECLYLPKTINFTEVINRFEQYLHKYVDNSIKIAYVFGGDNAEFMYCFEDDGVGVCVNRYKSSSIFNQTKQAIKNPNCYFIKEDKHTYKYSSRNYRKVDNIKDNKFTGQYLIRNEELLPFKNLCNIYGETKLKAAQVNFLNGLVMLLKQYVTEDIYTINLNDQLIAAKEKLKDKNTISLDAFYNGTINIRTSRLFNLDAQYNFKELLFDKHQIKSIPADKYILVDDDSVSGRTLKKFKEQLPDSVIIDSHYLLMSESKLDNIQDVIDLRDFIIGAENGGLKVQLPNNKIIRVPYIFPFVNLTTRASVPGKYTGFISKAIWQLNINFYESINPDIKLKDGSSDFICLMEYLGWSKETKLTDIFRYYMSNIYV